ncbi:MAG TPA: sigma-70 family RNA polymerase sigma factor [Bacteroidales bacterium]|nr:sigma-70 family RNA polymerase sigma factor [Bacteroidales bacterium]
MNYFDKLVTYRNKQVPIEKFSEEDAIVGLKDGDVKVIRRLYNQNLPAIYNLINQFPGIIFESEDLLQEGIIRMIMNIRDNKFKGQSAVNTYLYGICRNICLKEARKSKGISFVSNHNDLIDEPQDDYFDLLQAIMRIKDRLEEKCIEILNLRFHLYEDKYTHQSNGSTSSQNLMPFEDIAISLGIHPDNARQRFKRCLDRLIDAVKREKVGEHYFNG